MQHWTQNHPDYETVRAASIWQKLKPRRFPARIVRVADANEVAAVITDADTASLTLSVTGTGHNFAGTQLLDGSVLIDVSGLDEIAIEGDRVHVGPGATSRQLATALNSAGLMFPTGHHGDAACSVLGQAYVVWMSQWDDAVDDTANLDWAQTVTDALLPMTVGAYVNESDVIHRPERARLCFSPQAWDRLHEVRAVYDRHNRFAGPQQSVNG